MIALISMISTVGTAAFGAYGVIRSASLEQPSLSPTDALFATKAPQSISRRELKRLAFVVGALAIITGGVVYVMTTRLTDSGIEPLRLPPGFKTYSWDEANLGFAIPENWEPLPRQTATTFISTKDDSLTITVSPADPLKLLAAERDPTQLFNDWSALMKDVLPNVRITSKPEERTHQGRPAYRVDTEFVEGSKITKGTMYMILDKANSRGVSLVFFPVTQQSETVVSTFNLGSGTSSILSSR
jgi:hypothetical protein